MQNLNLTNLIFAAFVLVWIVRRQLAPKVIRFKGKVYVVIILVGLLTISDAFTKQHLTIQPGQAVLFGGASLLSAVVFGGLRAWSYRFWVNDDGLVMRQGNWLTLTFWIISITGHLLADRLWTGSSVTITLYLGLTLLIQRGGVWWLAHRAYPQALRANEVAQARHSAKNK
ncbi:hypothetical protein D1831_07610 [Lactiplantibacillus garii]|uniref:Integral membrane protein n=1 Tax=Lactiplantibacillus garii TaxID=2306423 RepID=A0A3R8QR25_9LACO|nr:hypothetical protein [Lactiplantibacillus garii]RRK10416.1 hypothetical protein D1831_07610 [Lactiplantibacillus garii]